MYLQMILFLHIAGQTGCLTCCHPCLWTLVRMMTGFHGLQGVDASQHHQMITNSHRMFRPFKTMTPFCWRAHSEYDDVSHCVSGSSTPSYLKVYISEMKLSLPPLLANWRPNDQTERAGGCKNTLYHGAGNSWKKYLFEKLESEI